MKSGRFSRLSAPTRTLTGALMLVAWSGAALAQQAPLFPFESYSTTDLPEGIAAGDATGDGNLDLVTVDRNGGFLTVLVGDGAGGFSHAPNLGGSEQVTGLAIADISGDGIADVVNGSALSSALSLHVADGAGFFLPPQPLAVPLHPESVAAGDMDGDGKIDLVSAAFAAATVVVQLGNGSGAFVLSGTGTAGAGARNATLADLDGDGDLDVATSNQNAASVSLLFGNGAGGFTSVFQLPAKPSLRSLAVGDLDADGHLDLAAGPSSPAVVDVWRGTGGGAFAAPVTQALGGSAYALSMLDFDADGKLDLVAADRPGSALRWMSGNGAGGFGPVHAKSLGLQPWSMTVADLDADADFDVAFVLNDTDRAIVLLAQAPGLFPDNAHGDLGGTSFDHLHSVAAGDVTGDGVADVICTDSSPTGLHLFAGDGTGDLLAPQLIATAPRPSEAQPVDMNGDGHLDLVYLSTTIAEDFTTVQLADGAGGFAAPVSTLVPGGFDLALGDMNADGNADAVVLQEDVAVPDQFHVLLGDGAGGLGAPATVELGSINVALKDELLADVTGDGRLDVVVLASSSAYVLAAAAGPTGFLPAVSFNMVQGTAQPLALTSGDFDADGSVDLAVCNNGAVTVRLNDGAGAFPVKLNLAAQSGARMIAQRDLDGDGLQDLVTGNVNSRSVSVLRGAGAGSFAPSQNFFLVEGAPAALAVADMDGDGAPDLVLGHDAPPAFTVLRNFGEASVWTDLGHALVGTSGAPALAGTGELLARTQGTIALTNAAPLAPAALFLSLQSQPQPFKGGVLVPLPSLLVLPLPTGPDGAITLPFTWPAGIPTGTAIYLQMAIQDAGAPACVSLSNALKGLAG
jgi:hypothetical protein